MIAMHHYSQYILSEGLSASLFYWLFSTQGGYAGVAIFFFLSGYGLMESETKRHMNLWQFIVRRFWKIYKAVLIINVLCYGSILCWKYFQTGIWEPITWKYVYSITKLDYYLWFIVRLFTCYLGFVLCTQIKKEKIRNIAFLIGQILVYAYWMKGGEPVNHMVSIPLFTAGIYVSLFKEQTARFIKQLWMWMVLIAISAGVVYWSYRLHDAMPVHALFNVWMISVLLWIASQVEIHMNYKSFLGYISFPIYLVHHKIIMLSSYLGHVAPVLLFLLLTIYLGWLLQKTLEIKLINIKWDKQKTLSVK